MIVKRALEEPCRQIVENAGRRGASVDRRDKVNERNGPNRGYDAESMEYVDMLQAASSTRPRSKRSRCRTRRRSRRCCSPPRR